MFVNKTLDGFHRKGSLGNSAGCPALTEAIGAHFKGGRYRLQFGLILKRQEQDYFVKPHCLTLRGKFKDLYIFVAEGKGAFK